MRKHLVHNRNHDYKEGTKKLASAKQIMAVEGNII
jgi:hypothetical protein